MVVNTLDSISITHYFGHCNRSEKDDPIAFH